jgi:hypothetical protein
MNKPKTRAALLGIVCLFTFAFTGCSAIAPPYQVSVSNQQQLQSAPAGLKMQVGEAKANDKLGAKGGSLSARTTSVSSPYADSWVQYVKEAMLAELRGSGRLDPTAPLKVDIELIENDLSAGSIVTGEAKVSAVFTITKGTQRIYQKTHRAVHTWESSFMGPIAIPAAVNNYGAAVQKLIAALFSDTEFRNLGN